MLLRFYIWNTHKTKQCFFKRQKNEEKNENWRKHSAVEGTLKKKFPEFSHKGNPN